VVTPEGADGLTADARDFVTQRASCATNDGTCNGIATKSVRSDSTHRGAGKAALKVVAETCGESKNCRDGE